MAHDLILSLNGETFFDLKKDFDAVLNRTLGNMEMKGASDATITLKLSIATEKRSMNVGDGIQDYKKPSFKHEITSVMQIKDKATGQLGGEYAMVWDEDEECFVLRKCDNGQTSIFDADYETVDEPVGQFRDLHDDSHALPAPAEEVDEGDVVVEAAEIDTSTPFGWLSQFVGDEMVVTEAMGNYTVRTVESNKIVLSSATSPENPFYCAAETLAPHVGHNIECAGYGDEYLANIAIECTDCNSVLFSLDAPEETNDEEKDAEEAEVDEAEEADESLDYEDDEEDGEDYDYEDPEEE